MSSGLKKWHMCHFFQSKNDVVKLKTLVQKTTKILRILRNSAK